MANTTSLEEDLQAKNQQVKQYKKQVDSFKAELEKCQDELRTARQVPVSRRFHIRWDPRIFTKRTMYGTHSARGRGSAQAEGRVMGKDSVRKERAIH